VVSPTEVQCNFPTSPLDRSSTMAWYLWTVFISINNVTFSTPGQNVVVYDARCIECNVTMGPPFSASCTQKVGLTDYSSSSLSQLICFIFVYRTVYSICGSYLVDITELQQVQPQKEEIYIIFQLSPGCANCALGRN